MEEFEKIISFESLYRAHRRARLGKRHKKEVILFEANLSENLWSIHYDLKYGRYKVSGYHSFMIYDPKEREIQAIGYRDRVVQHSLCDNFLIPLLERRLIYDNAACRKNKGTSFAIKRWREFMRRHYLRFGNGGYFVKADVSKYFPSIDHGVLKEKLARVVRDGRILTLLYSIIDSYNFESGKGLPMGNQTSQCFALLYLDGLDRMIKEELRIKHYVRYMDDMLIITGDKAEARRALSKIREKLTAEKLNLNEKSCCIAVSSGISFLGWRFFFGDGGRIVQTVKRASGRRMLSHARAHPYLGTDPKQSLVSYKGYLRDGNAYRLMRKISDVFRRSSEPLE